MNDIKEILVRDRIRRLRGDDEALRSRRARWAVRGDPGADRRSPTARGRLGRWIVGVGHAVGGPRRDPRGDAAGRPA